MCTSLRILQQCVNGCEQITQELKILSTYEEADVIAIQDLICDDGNYQKVLAPFRIATSSKMGNTALVAIAIVNDDLEVCDIDELCTKYCACISINSQMGDLYVLNVCLPESDDIDEALRVMDNIVSQLDGEMFVITMNTNAKSLWWSCTDKSDGRGDKIEDFILRHTLCVLNCKDPNGEQWTPVGYTDVTLSSPSVVNLVMKWMILGEVEGKRVARTDVMLQNLTYEKPKKSAKKVPRLEWVVEEDDDSVIYFEDNALTSFEGSTTAWFETDIDKVQRQMNMCKLNDKLKVEDSVETPDEFSLTGSV